MILSLRPFSGDALSDLAPRLVYSSLLLSSRWRSPPLRWSPHHHQLPCLIGGRSTVTVIIPPPPLPTAISVLLASSTSPETGATTIVSVDLQRPTTAAAANSATAAINNAIHFHPLGVSSGCLPPACLKLSPPPPLLSYCPPPAWLMLPPLLHPPSHCAVHLPPTVRQHSHRLVTAYSSSPRQRALFDPLLRPPLPPQPPPHQGTKASIHPKKTTVFATAVVPLLAQGTLLGSLSMTPPPLRSCATAPPPAIPARGGDWAAVVVKAIDLPPWAIVASQEAEIVVLQAGHLAPLCKRANHVPQGRLTGGIPKYSEGCPGF